MNKLWKPYQPSEQIPWNLPRVWMLHRRSGFGANWERLQRDLGEGFDRTISRVLSGDTSGTAEDEFKATSDFLLKKAVRSGQLSRLSAWWIMRMYLGPDPFAERRTLMWHNHFATSNRTIQNLFRMYRQNQIFRELGNGKFAPLLEKTIKDPTMLLWLNANENRKSHPNENLSRELMELFTLGLGNYTEKDVKEAARALAGWTISDSTMNQTEDPFSDSYEDKMQVRSYWQDNFFKTILGKKGIWNGDDVLRIVQEHPATSRRLAWRVCDELFGENVVPEEALTELATGLKEHDLDLSWAFETVLKSELFFSKANLKSRIAPPETYVLGCLIGLNTQKRPASTLALANIFASLGRSLFEPPNVGGWDGGRLWLNSRTIVARSNFVHAAVGNGLNRNATPPNFDEIIETFDDNKSIESVVVQMAELLLGLDRDSKEDQAMIAAVTKEVESKPIKSRWAHASRLMLNSNSAQLC